MTDTATMTAAPIEIRLGSQTCRARPLRLADIGEFESWMRQRLIQNTLEACQSLPAADRREVVNQVIGAAARLHFESPEAQGMMGSIEGAARLIWMACRREHPDLTLSDLLDRIDSIDQFGEVVDAVIRLSFPTVAPSASGTASGAGKKSAMPAGPSGSSST